MVTFADGLVYLSNKVLTGKGHKSPDIRFLLCEPFFVSSNRQCHLLSDKTVAIQENLSQTRQRGALRFIQYHLVVVTHGILSDGSGVGLVVLHALDAGRVLDLVGTLKPHVVARGIEIVAQANTVASSVFAAEEPGVNGSRLRLSLYPLYQTTEARCLVVKHFVHTWSTFLQSLRFNEGCIKLFLREIDANKDFFHTFVPSLMKELANSCLVLDSK